MHFTQDKTREAAERTFWLGRQLHRKVARLYARDAKKIHAKLGPVVGKQDCSAHSFLTVETGCGMYGLTRSIRLNWN